MLDASERTVCDCAACSRHCLTQPGMLAVGDLQRIAKRLGTDAAGKFVPSRGALARVRSTRALVRIPTITPARKPDGSCIFLTAEGRCSIHDIAPAGCAFFDSHMLDEEANRRSSIIHGEIMGSPEYAMQRASLAGEV